MTTYTLPYGKRQLTFDLPENGQVHLVAPKKAAPVSDPLEAVRRALAEPVGAKRLRDFTAGIRSVAIAINDKTRPVPHRHLLPPLLDTLGLPPEAVTLVIATGTHAPMPPEEYPKVVPAEILARYPVICHNSDDRTSLVHLGQTERGTPVWINRHFMEADLRIVVGNIEPHQFAGFSGGVKSAVIGLGGTETVNHNHSMLSRTGARLGRFADNPVRQDIEEMGRMAGIHFALNAILNESKQILTALAGIPQTVMEQGIPQVRQIYQVDIPAPFDLVIASPGGHPKDINLYQAQKGLAHAALVTADEGAIILAAACPEGTGSDKYEQWVAGMTSYEAVFERFEREGFRVGPHKAFQIARDAARVRVRLLSEMPPAFVASLLLTPAPDIETALAAALADLPSQPRIGIMPWANATIPRLIDPG